MLLWQPEHTNIIMGLLSRKRHGVMFGRNLSFCLLIYSFINMSIFMTDLGNTMMHETEMVSDLREIIIYWGSQILKRFLKEFKICT